WLAQPDFARHVVEEISAREARDVFEGVFLDGLTAGLAPAGGRDRTPQRSPRQRHKSALPGRVSAVARSVAGSPPLSIRRLALRAYIAVRMARLLDDDAHLSRP
ncbi:MAG TPA: hypothetical protein VJ787_00290, partial [Thermoleophilia bacterium]|nr:hypothetical protein [Thermoleophilia bacterium]